MRLLECGRRLVPPSSRAVPLWLRLGSVPLVAAAVVLGIWLTGGVITDDFTLAQTLTGVFLAAAGAAAVAAGLRWRSLALPVVATYALVAGVLGGYLLVTSHRDVTVREDVVRIVDDRPAPKPSETAGERKAKDAEPRAVARGMFRSGEHTTMGDATLIALPGGDRVLTLTDFDTSPGPDLRVYLTPGDGDSVNGYLDLGRLKGNKGDQQYDIPRSADLGKYGAVVIWCRAFTVAFGSATLA